MSKQQGKAADFFVEVPPHDAGAELAVLRAVLNPAYADTAPETLDAVAGIVRSDDFYSDANRRIFRALLAIRDAGEPIEITALHHRLETARELEATGGAAYIAEILQEISLPTHAEYYAGIVADKAKIRRSIHVAAGLLAECQAPETSASKVRQLLDAALNELDGNASIQLIGSRQWVLDGIAAIEAKAEPTIPTGFPVLDEKLSGGLRKKNQFLLGARPRVGKTTAAGNFIRNICFRQKIPTIFFSLEMTRQEILKRIVSDIADVYHGKILQSERLCKRDWEQINEASAILYESPFFIDDRCGITLSEMLSTIRQGVRKHGVQVVFVDQASLINAELPSPTVSKRDEITAVSVALKHIARELDIVVVLLCQLNRAGAQGPNGTRINEHKIRSFRPTLENLKESGSLEENADVVLLIHRPELLVPEEDAVKNGLVGYAEWIVSKNRHGKEGVIPMRFEGGFLRFSESDDREDEIATETPPNSLNDFAAFDGRQAATGEPFDEEEAVSDEF